MSFKVKGTVRTDGKFKIEILNEQNEVTHWTVIDDPRQPCAECHVPMIEHHNSEGWFCGCPPKREVGGD